MLAASSGSITFVATNGVAAPGGRLRPSEGKIHAHIKVRKDRTTFVAFRRYLRSLYPPHVRIAIVMNNFSLSLL
jgi:hypothetical protein